VRAAVQQKAGVRSTYRPAVHSLSVVSAAPTLRGFGGCCCCGCIGERRGSSVAQWTAVSTSRPGLIVVGDTRKTWTGNDVTSPGDRKLVARSTRQDVVVVEDGWSSALIRFAVDVSSESLVVKPDDVNGHRFESFGQPHFYEAVRATSA
jgi:hypothetical protein